MSITVREPERKPKADTDVSAREGRRKVYEKKRAISQEFQKAGVPKHVRSGRIAVRLQHVPDSMFRRCPSCGHDAWKWQSECPRCQTGLQ